MSCVDDACDALARARDVSEDLGKHFPNLVVKLCELEANKKFKLCMSLGVAVCFFGAAESETSPESKMVTGFQRHVRTRCPPPPPPRLPIEPARSFR